MSLHSDLAHAVGYNKTVYQILHGINSNNILKNEVHISFFIGLATSESLNVDLFYICNMQNAFNPKPTYYMNTNLSNI